METQASSGEDSRILLRKPCPAEQRLIARHECGYYRNIAVAAVYVFPSLASSSVANEVEFYARALRACIDSCPCLSSVYSRNATGETLFYRVNKIDLRNHFSVLSPQSAHESAATDGTVTDLLQQLHNEPHLSFANRKSVPNWRLDTYPLPDPDGTQRVFISFTYDHALADGLSGKIFHQIFLNALNTHFRTSHASAEVVFETRPAELPGLPHLPVSASYLLAPALGQYLPAFLSKLLGFRASVSGSDADTWAGSDTSAPPAGLTTPTAVQIVTVNNKTLSAVLKACRAHRTGLTALLNEIIARCIIRHLPAYSSKVTEKTNFVSCIPTDIRDTVGMPSDTTGVFSSAAYLKLSRSQCRQQGDDVVIDQTGWDSARENTKVISDSRLSATNQPTGLLAWISDFDSYCRQQIGKPRDGSWEISNLLSFRARLSTTDLVKVEKMFFCQPADATGWPLSFNVVSVHDGDMTICISRQPGSIGFRVEDGEHDFVELVLQDLKSCLEQIAVS